MTSRHNEQQETVTGGRKGQQNEALNLADFEIDDILSTCGERLLAEVGEDFGDPASLAAEFDAIALPLLSGAQGGTDDRVAAARPPLGGAGYRRRWHRAPSAYRRRRKL